MIRKILFLNAVLFYFSLNAIIDNRYLPLYHRETLTSIEHPSKFGIAAYFMTADEARDSSNKHIGIPELWGKFNQVAVSKALTLVGLPNPLDPQYQTQKELIWDWVGKISTQGLSFHFEKPIVKDCRFSIGMYFDLMHVQSRNEFILSDQIKTDLSSPSNGKLIELGQERRAINQELGLAAGTWSKTGLSDVEIYLKYNWLREYVWKCRKVDASLWFGAFLPTSVVIDIYNPASIPFGGDGHTGLYLKPALNLELKEDWTFGLYFIFLKRLPKTMFKRMPVNDEPIQYGAATGDARINPGFTFEFATYLEILDFWDTLGLRIGYDVIVHAKDKWTDKRKDQSVPVFLTEVQNHSSWINEYITLGFIYNLPNIKKFKKFEPQLYLDVDIPTHFFWAKDNCRTTVVSLGVEASF